MGADISRDVPQLRKKQNNIQGAPGPEDLS